MSEDGLWEDTKGPGHTMACLDCEGGVRGSADRRTLQGDFLTSAVGGSSVPPIIVRHRISDGKTSIVSIFPSQDMTFSPWIICDC